MLKSLIGFLLARPLQRPAAAPSQAEGRALETARALRQAGHRTEALGQLRRAFADAPLTPGLLLEFVGALIEADLCDRALAVAASALAGAPRSPEANLALGLAYHKLHLPARALEFLAAAERLGRGDAVLHDLRGSALMELGEADEALAAFERALELDPRFRLARFHRGLARLLTGDFERGWVDYELRDSGIPALYDGRRLPRWNGEPLRGRTLLIVREQGLGDEIMFASMLPELMRDARCLVECDPRLRGLFRRSFPQATVFGSIPEGGLPYAVAREPIDFAIPAGSLGPLLRRRAEDFPRPAAYLLPDPGRREHWKARLAALGPGLKVGISWSGGVRQTRQAVRSLELEALAPVLGVPSVRFVSLQYTAGARREVEGLRLRTGLPLVHWQEAIEDYDETAALVAELDLVVSVCTSLVHLTGALGRPAWVMAPFSPEWRYGLRGESMPWYPSVRLFRQPRYGDWAPVLSAVEAALRERAAPLHR